jgi:hypothetical protein
MRTLPVTRTTSRPRSQLVCHVVCDAACHLAYYIRYGQRRDVARSAMCDGVPTRRARTSLARTRIPATPISGAAGPLPIDGHLPASYYGRMPSSPRTIAPPRRARPEKILSGPASCSKCAATNGAADNVLDGRIEAVRVV